MSSSPASPAVRRWALIRTRFLTVAMRLRGKAGRNEAKKDRHLSVQSDDDREHQPLLTSAAYADDADTDNQKQPTGSTVVELGSITKLRLVCLMVALVLLGAVNGVVYKWVLNIFGARYAFFVDQGNNANYILFSGVTLLMKMRYQRANPAAVDADDRIDDEMMKRVPQSKFVFLGLLDGLGTFLSAVGGVYTPGAMQTLLNQLLIPFTMVISFFLLSARYTQGEVSGAAIIFAGAALTVGPSILGQDDTGFRWYSALIYTCSNIPMAFSAIFKQYAFQHARVDCFWLTFCVGTYQMLVSFAFAPALALPGFGGIAMNDIPRSFWQGARCWYGLNSSVGDECTPWNGVALTLYTLVNFSMNMCGLYLTKEGSAVLASMGYAIKLPVTNIAFAMCFIVGHKLCEPFTVWTALGLVVVLVGFSIYSYYMRAARSEVVAIDGNRPTKQALPNDGGGGDDNTYATLTTTTTTMEICSDVPDSFQDRVVGMGMAVV